MEQAVGTQQDIVPSVNTSEVAQEAPPEKVLRQSEVNELVGRVKHEAYTKGLKDAQGSVQSQPQVAQQQASGIGGMPSITEDHVRQIIADNAQQQAQMTAVNGMLSNFVQQMGTAKEKYSDFDETVANLGELKDMPHVVQLATGTGMAGDVMYELGKNPGKVATLTTLAYVNPNLAQAEMKKLADSIKKNQEASDVPNVNEPLSQVKPSMVGADNGSNSFRDLRNKKWAKV